MLAAIGSSALYVAAGQMALTPFGLTVGETARRHLTWLAAAFFLVLALGAWLGRVQEIVMPSGIIQGASYADVHARMPAALALMVAALVGAALAVASAIGRLAPPLDRRRGALRGHDARRRARTPRCCSALPSRPTSRCAKRRSWNTTSPRRARRSRSTGSRSASCTGEAALTRADIEANRETLDNVRLWDHQPLLETFGQIQEIRTYYDFVSVDNDRYRINGRNRQVMLSVRELNPAALPNRTWVNERLVFTHGHGLTLGPVNQVTSEGLPVLFVRDLPPVTTVDINITEPSIYFGELADDYVIVRTQRAGVPLSEGRRQRLHRLRRHRRRADRIAAGASCCSRCASARIRSC